MPIICGLVFGFLSDMPTLAGKWSCTYQTKAVVKAHQTDELWDAPPLVEPPVPHQVGKEDLRGLGFVGNASHLLENDNE